MKEWLDRAFLPMVTSVVNLRPLTALRNGMTYTIPIIIVGSLFFLFAHFPVDYIARWIDKTVFSMYFTQVYQATFCYCVCLCKRRKHRSLASRDDSLVCLPTTYSAT